MQFIQLSLPNTPSTQSHIGFTPKFKRMRFSEGTGARVSPGTVSNLNKKIYEQIEAWRNKPIEGDHLYVYVDGIVLKRSWAGEVRNVSLLVAIGVNLVGFREILGIVEGALSD